ncbi:MAG: VWA domain-containing protein [Myxococcales bacterium]|nr:VWA domain-containing protein [Myxococcales bacterium]
MLTLPLSLTRRVRETAFAPLLIALTLSSGCVRKQPPPEVPIAVEHEQDGARRNPVVAEPARDPELLQLAVQSARASVPTAGAELLVRVRVDTRELPDATRPPVNLGLVIDTSSSMAGDGITGAREAALELLDALREGDRLSVVTFGSRARALVPSTRIDARSRGDVRAAIEALEPSGTTALAEGLQTGLAEVFQHQVQGAINRVVLLSDGVPNDGAQIPALADSASARGVSITALGLGLEVDESVLAVLAQRSGGRFHYLESSTEVAAVFSEEVLRMQRVVGRNMALSLSPGPGVRVIEVVGTPMNPTGRGATVSLGDLSEGETRDVFVKVQVDAHREGATVELLDARLDFDDMVVIQVAGIAARSLRSPRPTTRARSSRASIRTCSARPRARSRPR